MVALPLEGLVMVRNTFLQFHDGVGDCDHAAARRTSSWPACSRRTEATPKWSELKSPSDGFFSEGADLPGTRGQSPEPFFQVMDRGEDPGLPDYPFGRSMTEGGPPGRPGRQRHVVHVGGSHHAAGWVQQREQDDVQKPLSCSHSTQSTAFSRQTTQQSLSFSRQTTDCFSRQATQEASDQAAAAWTGGALASADDGTGDLEVDGQGPLLPPAFLPLPTRWAEEQQPASPPQTTTRSRGGHRPAERQEEMQAPHGALAGPSAPRQVMAPMVMLQRAANTPGACPPRQQPAMQQVAQQQPPPQKQQQQQQQSQQQPQQAAQPQSLPHKQRQTPQQQAAQHQRPRQQQPPPQQHQLLQPPVPPPQHAQQPPSDRSQQRSSVPPPQPALLKQPSSRHQLPSDKQLPQPPVKPEQGEDQVTVGQLPNAVTCTYPAHGGTIICWEADARKLNGSDKMVVSPEFPVRLPGIGPQPFRMLIYAAALSNDRGSLSFRTTGGRGRVEIKCGAQLPPGLADVCVSIGVGSGERAQPLRGPVVHNFLHQSCCGLKRGDEEWDFRAAVNTGTKRLTIRAELTNLGSGP